MCKYKKSWGIGVCDLHLVNLALLGKQRLRLVPGISGLWGDILVVRYGVVW